MAGDDGLIAGRIAGLVQSSLAQKLSGRGHSTTGGASRFSLAQFLLRYLVIAAVVFATFTLDLVSLPAVFAGMCSFVVAMLVEASREFYFAIIEREEIS